MQGFLVLACALLSVAEGFQAPAPVRAASALGVKRPQLKGAKKHARNRPIKHAPSDKNRRPPAYNVEPQYYEGRPEESVMVTEGADNFDRDTHIKAVLASLASLPFVDNTDAEEDAMIISSIKFPDPAQALYRMAYGNKTVK